MGSKICLRFGMVMITPNKITKEPTITQKSIISPKAK
jgi:hypothetical protein